MLTAAEKEKELRVKSKGSLCRKGKRVRNWCSRDSRTMEPEKPTKKGEKRLPRKAKKAETESAK